MRMLILADDLSGAADCAIACVDAGLSALVQLDVDATPATAGAADVIAFDLDSRGLPPIQARELHARAVGRACVADPAAWLYKKFDSTLRGHVGVEIAACVDAGRQPGLVVVAPAFPAAGRTTRGGRVFVGGTPLEQTEVWMRSGMTGPANLPERLRAAGLHSALVGLDLVRGDGPGLQRSIAAHAAAGTRAIVCDAETEVDLDCIASAVLALEAKPVLAGSAGLARCVARRLGPREASAQPEPRVPDRPILTVVGSRASESRQQARRLAEAAPAMACFSASPSTLHAGEGASAWADIAAGLRRAVDQQRDVLLTTALDDRIDVDDGARLARRLAQLVAPLLPSFGALVATGGETARALLGALGVDSLRLVREFEPGVVLAFAEVPPRLAVVTKAGAFGHPGTLLNAWRQLCAARSVAAQASSPAWPSHQTTEDRQ